MPWIVFTFAFLLVELRLLNQRGLVCVNEVELSISVCYSVTLCLGVKLWELFNLNPCLCMAA